MISRMSLSHRFGSLVRVLAMACLLLPASSLLAQVSVSVDVGYGNKGYTYQSKGINAFDGSLPRGHSYYFAPRIGFLVSDGLRMGVQLGASYSSYDYVDGFFDSERLVWKQSSLLKQTVTTASATAFVRFRCLSEGQLSLHLEVSGTYGLGWGQDNKTEYRITDGSELDMQRQLKQRRLVAQVVPVLCYSFNKHIEMDVYLNLAALSFSNITTKQWPYIIKNYTPAEDSETTNTQQEFNIGVNALNSSSLTVGFGYTF